MQSSNLPPSYISELIVFNNNIELLSQSKDGIGDPIATGKIFLKLEDGTIKTVSAKTVSWVDGLQRFFGRLGFGAYSLSNIYRAVCKLSLNPDQSATNKEIVDKALDNLRVKITSHNKKSAKPFKIDINKLHATIKIADKAREFFVPGGVPHEVPPESVKVDHILQSPQIQTPQNQLGQLRNLMLDFDGKDPLKAKADLATFKQQNTIDSTSPYMLVEALKLAEIRESIHTRKTQRHPLPEVDVKALDEVFLRINSIDAATNPDEVAQAEGTLDSLSKELLDKAQEAIPQATCDALYYARGVLNEKKQVLGPKMGVVAQDAPQPNEFGIIKQAGDGACLFRSFATNLVKNNIPFHNSQLANASAEPHNVGPDRYHQYLRQEVAETLAITWSIDDGIKYNILDGVEEYNRNLENQLEYDRAAYDTLCPEVREKMAQRFYDQYSKNHISLESEESAIQKYIDLLKGPGFWGGNLEIVTLGRLYNVPVRVYEMVNGVILPKAGVEFDPEVPIQENSTVNLYYANKDHFDAYDPRAKKL